MVRAIKPLFLFCLASLALSAFAGTQISTTPAVAYVKNNALTITAEHGEVMETVVMRPPVSDFAISNDHKQIVVVSNADAHGGELEMIDLRTRLRSKLAVAPVYFTHPQEHAREVYADPHFSPDGRKLVFAVHLSSEGNDHGVVDAAGPLAIMDLVTSKTQVVRSTTDVHGHGPCYSNTPLWSPDGSQVVFNCETGSAITSPDGVKLNMLPTGTEQYPWSAVIGWVGNRCLLYVQALDAVSYDTYGVRLLNLRTLQSQDARWLITRQRAQIAGLSEVSSNAAISRTALVKFSTFANHWVLPKDSPAHLLGGWPKGQVPTACR
jgi:hypothetical protein